MTDWLIDCLLKLFDWLIDWLSDRFEAIYQCFMFQPISQIKKIIIPGSESLTADLSKPFASSAENGDTT